MSERMITMNRKQKAKYEIGEEIDYPCQTCGMRTAHEVIPSTYSDTQAVACCICGGADEYIV